MESRPVDVDVRSVVYKPNTEAPKQRNTIIATFAVHHKRTRFGYM
jgi:hypothetical protein